MRVSLVDVDSRIPNLALMRASTWHKQRGDEVKLGYEPLFDDPDICYTSKMFDFTAEPQYMPDCETLKGGPGYSLTENLVGFNTDREYDLHRIYTLRDMGANPFVMPFDKSDRYQKDLARWCNNKFIFKSTRRFEDYNDRVR